MTAIPSFDIDGARIAVLVARSSVVRRDSGLPIAYTLGDSASLTADELARRLAVLPKPLRVQANLQGRYVALWADPLGGHPQLAAIHEWMLRQRTEKPPLAFLSRRFGKGIEHEQLGVTCHGAGEFVQVTAGGFGVWERDYHHIDAHGYGADFADSQYPAAQGAELGVFKGPGFVNFGWADDAGEAVIYWREE